jgi:hypothetical protein
MLEAPALEGSFASADAMAVTLSAREAAGHNMPYLDQRVWSVLITSARRSKCRTRSKIPDKLTRPRCMALCLLGPVCAFLALPVSMLSS